MDITVQYLIDNYNEDKIYTAIAFVESTMVGLKPFEPKKPRLSYGHTSDDIPEYQLLLKEYEEKLREYETNMEDYKKRSKMASSLLYEYMNKLAGLNEDFVPIQYRENIQSHARIASDGYANYYHILENILEIFRI